MKRNWLRTARAVARVHSICDDNSLNPRALLDLLGEASGQLRITTLNLEYAELGGVNNLGMFLHYGESGRAPLALSKIQTPELAEREFRFIRWSHSQGERLTAEPVYYRQLSDDLAVTSSTFLQQPSRYLSSAIHALHWRLMQVKDYEYALGNSRALRDQVRPDTNIRKVLHYLVSEERSEKALEFIETFLQERQAILGQRVRERIMLVARTIMRDWEALFEREAGLVHGDFKRQNILSVSDFDYRLIDLQYYLVGIRSWDLAFYYSKYEEGFTYALMDYRGANRILRTSDESLFVFLYLIASSLKIKPKHREQVMRRKLLPALNYFEYQGIYAA
ncbi:phosphotransferase [Thalassolituus maritimus]|uniref:Aminoglycoside phosphotransferase domain-containing protein n=1 Tax=Thalassolituus maritimus TaxID=484498 RepID=A0ABQ0A2J3_9GAMM